MPEWQWDACLSHYADNVQNDIGNNSRQHTNDKTADKIREKITDKIRTALHMGAYILYSCIIKMEDIKRLTIFITFLPDIMLGS